MLSKVYYKDNKKSKINLGIFCSLVRLVCFYVVIIVSTTHGMEINENDGIFGAIKDVVPKILGEFHKVSPICREFYQKPSDVKGSVISGLVCKKWRSIILGMRRDNNCKLCVPEFKKLITLADYQTIQDSGYKVLDIFPESLDPKDVSYLNCLVNVTQLTLLPPRTKEKVNGNESPKQYIKSNVIQNIHLLENLAILNLELNNIESDDLKNIVLLKNLVKLDLTFNKPNDEILLRIPSLLKKLTFLRILYIPLPDNFENIIQNFKKLLPYCKINGFWLDPTIGQTIEPLIRAPLKLVNRYHI